MCGLLTEAGPWDTVSLRWPRRGNIGQLAGVAAGRHIGQWNGHPGGPAEDLRGTLPASGTWTGPDGIMDGFFSRIFGRLDAEVPVVQDVHRIIADGEYAVAEWTTHARTRDGRCYDSDYAGVFRVVGGRLAAVTEHLDTAYAKQMLFSS